MQYDVIRHSADWMTNKEPKYFGLNLWSTRPTGVDVTFAANPLTGPKVTLSYLARDLIQPDGKVNTIQKLKEQIKKDFYSKRYERAAGLPNGSTERNVWEHAELKDSTAATAAAKVWPYVTDVMKKEKQFGKYSNDSHANSAGKHEKSKDSGKNQGGWIRKQFLRHSYDVIRTDDYLEHKIKSPKIYQQQHSGYYSPNLHEKVIYEVQDRGGELPKVVFAFVAKNGNETFESSMDCTSRMISDKSAIEKVILNRFNYGLGHTASEYGELDKVQLAKFVNLIQKRLLDYSKGSDYYTLENGKLQKHHADPKITADPHPQHSGYYSPNLRHSYDTVRTDDYLEHHGVKGQKWGVVHEDDIKQHSNHSGYYSPNLSKPNKEQGKSGITIADSAYNSSSGVGVEVTSNKPGKKPVKIEISWSTISGNLALGGYDALGKAVAQTVMSQVEKSGIYLTAEQMSKIGFMILDEIRRNTK